MQKLFFFFTEMEKVSNWCDVLSRILQGQHIDVESVMSMKAALHFRKGFVKNSEIHLNTKFENIESVWYYSSIWYMNSLKNFWMWNAWDIHHHHERDHCWQMMNDAIKWAKARVFVYADSVLCLAKMEQVSGAAETVERQTWRHWYVFTISRCSGNRWRSNWTRVEKIPRFFQDCPFFKRSRKTWYRRASNRRTKWSSCQCSTTSVEIRWSELHLERWESQRLREAVPSRTLDVSWSRHRDDMERRFSRTTTQRNKTPYFHRHQCLESMSSQTMTKQKYHSLQ